MKNKKIAQNKEKSLKNSKNIDQKDVILVNLDNP